MRTDTTKAQTLRLAAIDLDGTLLSPDLSISAENLAAVQRLAASGIDVAIASGRHFDSIQKFLGQLPGVKWIVSAQGAEVSDRTRERILHRRHLDAAQLHNVLVHARDRGISAIVYTSAGTFTDAPDDDSLAFYRELAAIEPHPTPFAHLCALNAYKIVWVGRPDRIDAVMKEEPFVPDVQRVRTHARIVEFMPHAVTKATALEVLASHLGVSAASAVVFGDADNDIPMFRWAGVSVAMAHAWPTAKAEATHVGPAGPKETALARSVDWVLTR